MERIPKDEPVALEAVLGEIERQFTTPHALARTREPRRSEATRHVQFSLADHTFLVPIESVVEVGIDPVVSPLPNLVDWVEGIFHYHGEILSLVDLSRFIGWQPPRDGSRTTLLLKDESLRIGFRVDGILGSVSIDRKRVDVPASMFEDPGLCGLIHGGIVHDDRLAYLLDPARLLRGERIHRFTRQRGESA